MAEFTNVKARIPEEYHKIIIQYADDSGWTIQEMYSEVVQEFLNSLDHDFIDYIEAPINRPQIGIAVKSDIYNDLVKVARQSGHHIATVIHTAVLIFLRKRK